MSENARRNRSAPLILLGFFTVVLMFFLSWSFRADQVIAGSFRLEEVQICEELDDNMNPINIGRSMPNGTKQVCLWFTYSRAREGDSLGITWSVGDRAIQKEMFRISQTKGTRAFYLLKEDGTLLPGGSYSVTIYCNGREKSVLPFSIAAASGDVYLDQGDFLDY